MELSCCMFTTCLLKEGRQWKVVMKLFPKRLCIYCRLCSCGLLLFWMSANWCIQAMLGVMSIVGVAAATKTPVLDVINIGLGKILY